jgi:hypothetical protein
MISMGHGKRFFMILPPIRLLAPLTPLRRDEHNPIGAIAQAHTNLTEVKLATQLLWRVGVKPEQVVLGYGFYGRAFELADPSCTTPGCPFAGGAKKGPCSNEAGILMYYEIQAILEEYPDLEPIFDEEAAVKYVTWDDNQWISYDDADTFAVKLEWANEMGFGGSMIWAVDTDDDKFSAMSGLMGYQVSHMDTSETQALAMTDSNVVATLKLENGEGCKIMTDYDCTQLADMTCPDGQEMVSYDRNGCVSLSPSSPFSFSLPFFPFSFFPFLFFPLFSSFPLFPVLLLATTECTPELLAPEILKELFGFYLSSFFLSPFLHSFYFLFFLSLLFFLLFLIFFSSSLFLLLFSFPFSSSSFSLPFLFFFSFFFFFPLFLPPF